LKIKGTHAQTNKKTEVETMKTTKTLKTKLVLGILAAALSLSLAIGGTLMLFTAESEVATNVVTLGNAKIALQEATSSDQNYYDSEGKAWDVLEGGKTELEGYKTVGVTYGEGADAQKFDGIDFGKNVVPGAAFAKAPRVVNTGSVPVYVKVEGVFTITAPGGYTEDDWKAVTEESVLGLFYSRFDKVVLGYDDENWDGITVTVEKDTTDKKAYITGTWYYTEDKTGSVYGTLKSLEAGKATEPIFTGIQLPIGTPNEFADFGFSFDLTAYAVQSENNAPVGIGAEAHESVFGGEAAE
jgi:predicted ribosomally synthesized peptide with SipW-like signal peptide